MKKVLALVLAFVMVAGMATVAFAAKTQTAKEPVLGTTFYSYNSDDKAMNATKGADLVPGNKFYLLISLYVDGSNEPCFAGDAGAQVVDADKSKYNLDYHKVSYKLEEGNKLFDGAKIVTKEVKKGDIGITGTYYFLELATKDNMSLDSQDIEISGKLVATRPSDKAVDSNEESCSYTFAYKSIVPANVFSVSGKGVVEFEDYSDEEWQETEIYFGNTDITFANKMYKEKDMYLKFSDAEQDKYEELYGEKAALEYAWFTQPKAFKQAGTLTIPADLLDGEKAPYLYEEKDGKLVMIKNAYDKEKEAFILKDVKVLGKYIVSDVDLEVKAAEGDKNEDNPETGANDVVAIAAGLAVVSLVAAGAVSLKK